MTQFLTLKIFLLTLFFGSAVYSSNALADAHNKMSQVKPEKKPWFEDADPKFDKYVIINDRKFFLNDELIEDLKLESGQKIEDELKKVIIFTRTIDYLNTKEKEAKKIK